MKRKAASLIISFFIFVFSVPQKCFAELGTFFEKQDNPVISCSAMKAASLLDISKNVIKINYENAKDFFITAYFENAQGKEIPVICNFGGNRIIPLANTVIWNSKNSEIRGGICYLAFDDFRQRGSPPSINGSILTEKIYLLSLEALHKGSVPADNNILKLNNI